jgi:hypothetical protein
MWGVPANPWFGLKPAATGNVQKEVFEVAFFGAEVVCQI